MKISLRTKTYETKYIDGDITQPKLVRVPKYKKDSEGNLMYKGGKKVKNRIRNKSERFYLDIYVPGQKRRYEDLNIIIYPTDSKEDIETKKRLALSIKNKREQEYVSAPIDSIIPHHKQRVDFFMYADRYVDRYRNKDIRKVTSALSHFKSFIISYHNSPRISLSGVDRSTAQEFVSYLKRDSGLSGGTPSAYLKKLKAIFKQARYDHYIQENPFDFVNTDSLKIEDQVRKEVLSEEELQGLAKTSCGNEFVRLAFLFACYTAMGLAEIKALKWTDIDVKNKEIRYRRAKTGVLVKLYINDTTDLIVSKLYNKKSNQYVFGCFDIPSSTAINKTLKSWCKRAGITKHITFYCARHTFGTRALRTSKNLKTVAVTMGHNSTRFTENYARIIDGEDKEAVKAIPAIKID